MPATIQPSYDAPTSLNGYPVIAYRRLSNGYATVMVERDTEYEPFVVATWYPELERGWIWGHYLATETEAHARFEEVHARNAARY